MANVIRSKLGADRVYTAADGREAIALLEREEVDIIISDWNMPEVSGDELLLHVRRHPRYRDTPFIMATTNNQRDFIITALQLGVTQYIIKPFTAVDFERKIRASWSTAMKRRSERFAALPGHNATLSCADQQAYAADLIDLSSSGALVRVAYGPQVALYGHFLLSIAMGDEASGRRWTVQQLPAQGVRLEADDPKLPTCLLALQFIPEQIDRQVAADLASLMRFLEGRTPGLIQNS